MFGGALHYNERELGFYGARSDDGNTARAGPLLARARPRDTCGPGRSEGGEGEAIEGIVHPLLRPLARALVYPLISDPSKRPRPFIALSDLSLARLSCFMYSVCVYIHACMR
jgi:hypothetical protein